MLVLSRKSGEEVVIDGPALLKVLEVQGDRICLGFTASRDVRIDRKEIWLARQRDGEIPAADTGPAVA